MGLDFHARFTAAAEAYHAALQEERSGEAGPDFQRRFRLAEDAYRKAVLQKAQRAGKAFPGELGQRQNSVQQQFGHKTAGRLPPKVLPSWDPDRVALERRRGLPRKHAVSEKDTDESDESDKELAHAKLLEDIRQRTEAMEQRLHKAEDMRREHAATSIQAWWRGVLGRQVVAEMRRQRMLQLEKERRERRRRQAERQVEQIKKRQETAAAVKIQAAFRARKARARVREEMRKRREEEDRKWAERMALREEAKRAAEEAKKAEEEAQKKAMAAQIQREKKALAQKLKLMQDKKLEWSATRIQSRWRGRRDRRIVEEQIKMNERSICQNKLDLMEQKRRLVAAQKIQAVFRGKRARDANKAERARVRAERQALQDEREAWQRYTQQRLEEERVALRKANKEAIEKQLQDIDDTVKHHAATKIQAAFRGGRARREHEDIQHLQVVKEARTRSTGLQAIRDVIKDLDLTLQTSDELEIVRRAKKDKPKAAAAKKAELMDWCAAQESKYAALRRQVEKRVEEKVTAWEKEAEATEMRLLSIAEKQFDTAENSLKIRGLQPVEDYQPLPQGLMSMYSHPSSSARGERGSMHATPSSQNNFELRSTNPSGSRQSVASPSQEIHLQDQHDMPGIQDDESVQIRCTIANEGQSELAHQINSSSTHESLTPALIMHEEQQGHLKLADLVYYKKHEVLELRKQLTIYTNELERLRMIQSLGADLDRCDRCDEGLANLQPLLGALHRIGAAVFNEPYYTDTLDGGKQAILNELAVALKSVSHLDPQFAELVVAVGIE